MKKLLSLLLVAAMGLSLVGCGGSDNGSKSESKSDLEYVKDKGTLVVGVTDFAPMDYKDESGNWIGFDADMASAFAESLGVKAEFVEIDWDNKIMELDGKTVTIGGIAKGSGMIHINMGTMLSFVTTDAAVSSDMLREALREAVEDSYNMVSVDGDTSTNDTLAIMASGKAGNKMITNKNEDYYTFLSGLTAAFRALAKKLAGDGEGATKLLVCKVEGAKSKPNAVKVAKSIIGSSLVKAAMFGSDANWGRVLCAIGYSGADVDVKKVDVSFESAKGNILVCKDGAGVEFSEEKAKEILLEKEINILVSLNDGFGYAEAYGCDLTYDYVKINGDYRT